jgi:micrococcal nuclease
MRFIIAFLLVIQIIACGAPHKDPLNDFTGKVVSIADGDTFTLLTEENDRVKVRLHGIDCPEKKQDFGQVAKQKLGSLVFSKTVHVVKKDVDRYGRTVGLVYDDHNICVNEAMLKAGLAWHYLKYDQNPEWQQMENTARENHLGLWSQADPTPPWEWRHH